jgi:hypothetical protein
MESENRWSEKNKTQQCQDKLQEESQPTLKNRLAGLVDGKSATDDETLRTDQKDLCERNAFKHAIRKPVKNTGHKKKRGETTFEKVGRLPNKASGARAAGLLHIGEGAKADDPA